MKDFRSIYDDLKSQTGDKLLTADAIRQMKTDELAPRAESTTPSNEEEGLKFGNIDDVNPDEVMLGDVKMKDLLIAAVNTLIKDNDDQLWDEDEPGIECTVKDILDYAGIDIDELFQDESLRDYVLCSGEDECRGTITFLDKMICSALTEFGNRGWDITLVDAVTEERICSIEEGIEIFKDLYKICGITEEECKQTMKGLRLLMIMNEFENSEITITFEDPNDTPEEDKEYDKEYEDDNEPSEEDHIPDTAFTRSLDRLEEYLNKWFREHNDDEDDYDEEVY